MILIRYVLYFWNPPILSPEQEIEVGHEIIATGGTDLWKKKAPYLPSNERERAERYATAKPNIASVVICVVMLLTAAALILAPGPAGLAGVTRIMEIREFFSF